MYIYNTYFECVVYLFVYYYMIIVGGVIECAGNALEHPGHHFYGFYACVQF